MWFVRPMTCSHRRSRCHYPCTCVENSSDRLEIPGSSVLVSLVRADALNSVASVVQSHERDDGDRKHMSHSPSPPPRPSSSRRRPQNKHRRWATEDLDEAISWCKTPPEPSMRFLLDHITETVQPPYDASALSEPFAMAVNNIGRCLRQVL